MATDTKQQIANDAMLVLGALDLLEKELNRVTVLLGEKDALLQEALNFLERLQLASGEDYSVCGLCEGDGNHFPACPIVLLFKRSGRDLRRRFLGDEEEESGDEEP